jgi:hypothetical protein
VGKPRQTLPISAEPMTSSLGVLSPIPFPDGSSVVTGFEQSSIKSATFWKLCARREITVAHDRPYPVREIASEKSFAAWLVKQVGRGDSVSDLAADAIHNPPSGNRVRNLDGQMRHRNASPEAFDALKKGVREWITTPDGWDAFMEAEAIMSRVNEDAGQDA